MALFSVLIILACVHVHSVRSAIGSSEINCVNGGSFTLGTVDEGYEGDVEIITNIGPNDRPVLQPTSTVNVLTILELVYTEGDSTAIVRTIKPLDAEEIRLYSDALYYFITCARGPKNHRTLYVRDVNEHPPIFQSKTYSAMLSETTALGSFVLTVRATDADATDNNKRIWYSILPPVPDAFELDTIRGYIRLIKRPNYNNVQQYIFTVEAKDIGELRDTTTVTITVKDFDNLNPYFDHSLYKASIVENQVGHFSDITPEAIKAQDGDTGINEPVVYSITAVLPNKYQNNFEIDRNSGVISVTTALDREEIDQITVYLQATQQDDASKTANTVVLVTIEDVNDNPPKFEYTTSILENALQGQFVLQTRVTELDLGGFSKGHFIMDSDTFVINSQGVISLRSNATLDRETIDNYNIEVVAVDQPVDGLSTTAQVSITVLDVNDNNPQFLPLPERIEIQEGVYTPSSPGEVCVISATDSDIGENGRVTITTYSHSDLFSFREDGTLLVIGELDRETQDVYDVVIAAMDHAVPPRINITTVRVSVTAVNDNALVKTGSLNEIVDIESSSSKD
ncbi:protocadherin Fat 4-like isoform X1 [Ctenopharyngodon idella]|uniref:protocadherin Fat 4-like isoform X1 n=1 Tax=Ctenopharyngodon idella TaxID=7959 RepID=UPI00222F898A|nr:protocadherin Fat 4-like isoform X1 [Ctenopharyngodon idella]